MPEIEVPGHSRAVAAAYPEILCDYIDPGKHELSQNSWCAANERGYEILGDILKEVAGLFPCPYIHIGGDEVEMEYWENCRRCTGLMKEKHFEKPAEVQNYFIHRVAELVEAAGKKMGGWSEIMDGGELPSGTVVFSWIGLDHGIAAARKGLPVVMMLFTANLIEDLKRRDFNNAFVHTHRSDDGLIISDCPQQISGFGAHIPVQ